MLEAEQMLAFALSQTACLTTEKSIETNVPVKLSAKLFTRTVPFTAAHVGKVGLGHYYFSISPLSFILLLEVMAFYCLSFDLECHYLNHRQQQQQPYVSSVSILCL